MRVLLQSFSFLRHNCYYNVGALLLQQALGATARDIEIEVMQSDYFDDLDQVAATIRARSPDVLGLSVFIWSRDLTTKLLAKLGDAPDRPWLICGGSGLSHEAKSFLEQSPTVDVVVPGAGEQTFADLLATRRRGGELSEVAGITYRASDGSIRSTPEHLRQLDSSQLRSPYCPDYVHSPALPRFLHLETQRYCPYHCSYCTWAKGGSAADRWLLPLAHVVQAIDLARERRFVHVNFLDSAINYDSERFSALLDAVDRPGPDGHETTYSFFLSLDFLDERQLRRLQALRTRCFVSIGVESFSTEALRMAHRSDHLARLPGLLAGLSANPYLQIMVGLLLGLPGDSLETFTRGLALLERTPRVRTLVSLLAVTPGTQMRTQAAEYGMAYAATGVPFLHHSHAFPTEDLERALARINELATDGRAFLNSLSVPVSRLANPEILPAHLRGTPERWVCVGVVGIADGLVTGSGVYPDRNMQV